MLALVSGRGALPAAVACAQAVPPLICVLEGFDPDELTADIIFRLERLGSFLEELKTRGVTEVCFCGAIQRPVFDTALIDAPTLPLVPVLQEAFRAGDDAALRGILKLFVDAGFAVRGAHELAPDILIPEGQHGIAEMPSKMQTDISRADAILAALAPLDVGQACVVGGGQVWGIETVGGTDHMLRTLPPEVHKAQAVLVKAPKAGQEMRADMPTVGPETIRAAHSAGLAGVVVDAGRVVLVKREETIAEARAAGLVFWARTRD